MTTKWILAVHAISALLISKAFAQNDTLEASLSLSQSFQSAGSNFNADAHVSSIGLWLPLTHEVTNDFRFSSDLSLGVSYVDASASYLNDTSDVLIEIWLNNTLLFPQDDGFSPFVAADVGIIKGNNSQLTNDGAVVRLHGGFELAPASSNISLRISAGVQK